MPTSPANSNTALPNPPINADSSTVTTNGEITWPPPQPKVAQAPKPDSAKEAPAPEPPSAPKAWWLAHKAQIFPFIFLGVGGFLLYEMGKVVPPDFLQHMTVFVLACFVGYMVIWNVTPSLHTPLMSVTNAISGIIVIGALLQISGPLFSFKTLLSAIAILIATINVAGGFLVTQRMLKMFRKGGDS